MAAPVQPDPIAFFEDWVRSHPVSGRESLSPKSALAYRYVWHSWIKHLAGADADADHTAAQWLDVSMSEIEGFLQNCARPSSGRRSRSAPISVETRKRYLKLFAWLYGRAVAVGLVAHNPIREAFAGDPGAEQMSQVFSPRQWDLIAKEFPKGNGLWELRDRAILALLMDVGLTTAEICSLRLRGINPALTPLFVEIEGSRKAQGRTLRIGARAAGHLRAWLDARAQQPWAADGDSDQVFVTQKGYPMSSRPLFHLVATTVIAAHARADLNVPLHVGPAVLRNTRIVRWINAGIPIEEVARRAGHKDHRSFRLLKPHISGVKLPSS